MSEPISILIVSYHFPPSAEVGGKRMARFCKYLPELNIRPVVLTIDEASLGSVDNSLQLPDTVKIARVRPKLTPLAWYGERAERRAAETASSQPASQTAVSAPVPKHGLKEFVRQQIIALLTNPDQQWGWYRPAVDAAKDIIEKYHPQVVISSGPPWTALKVGHAIAKRYNVPWIADFRDAWVSDQWRYGAFPEWRNRMDWNSEDRWLKDAALIVSTTEQLQASLVRTHPTIARNRFATISNGFDGEIEQVQPRQCDANESKVMLHAGELYGGRRIDTFCVALKKLLDGGRLRPDSLKVRFFGKPDPKIEAAARKSAPEVFDHGIIELLPKVPYKEVQAAMRESDLLLIFQGDHATAIPAKFFEYLQAAKPIFAVVGEGALADIVRKTDAGFVVPPNDANEIARILELALGTPPRRAAEVERTAMQYHFRTLTAQLGHEIRRIVNKLN